MVEHRILRVMNCHKIITPDQKAAFFKNVCEYSFWCKICIQAVMIERVQRSGRHVAESNKKYCISLLIISYLNLFSSFPFVKLFVVCVLTVLFSGFCSLQILTGEIFGMFGILAVSFWTVGFWGFRLQKVGCSGCTCSWCSWKDNSAIGGTPPALKMWPVILNCKNEPGKIQEPRKYSIPD